mgnify:CR=1 FL=1
MLTPTEVRALVERYVQMMCDTDVDGILALFAEGATAEDPVGGNVQEGKEAIHAFYAGAAPALQVKLAGPVCVAGNACAFPLLATLTMGDTQSYLDATDVFTFDDQGLITSMKAYWNFDDVRSDP